MMGSGLNSINPCCDALRHAGLSGILLSFAEGFPTSGNNGKRGGAALLFLCFILSLVILIFSSATEAREITDMTGRKVVVPDRIAKVFATSPPGTYLLYAIDPSVIAGLNFPLWENEKKYTVKRLQTLPVIGGVVGQGRSINQELLLSVRPDIIIIWSWKDTALNKQYEEIFSRLRIPWVNISLDSLADYPEALSFVGALLNKEERGRRLSRYAKESLREVKSVVDRIPLQERLRVYYAEGPDGLATEGEGSVHAELIPMAGGINAHRGNSPDRYGMEKVSLEQVMAYNPDVILVKERLFFDAIFKDPRWKNIKAVKERRVYLIPYQPFNWFDRPPSFMRLLGAKWLASTLYPRRYSIDMVKQTREFYRLFLGVDITDPEARKVLKP